VIRSARLAGAVREKDKKPAPDWEKYEMRKDMIPMRSPNGTAVSYSTEGAEHYAPFRGKVGCISKTGYQRAAHRFDRDGVCYWCNAFDPREWSEVRQ